MSANIPGLTKAESQFLVSSTGTDSYTLGLIARVALRLRDLDKCEDWPGFPNALSIVNNTVRADWARSGLPVFRLTDALVAKLLLTETPNCAINEIPFPHPTFMLELPPGWISLPSSVSDTSASVDLKTLCFSSDCRLLEATPRSSRLLASMLSKQSALLAPGFGWLLEAGDNKPAMAKFQLKRTLLTTTDVLRNCLTIEHENGDKRQTRAIERDALMAAKRLCIKGRQRASYGQVT